MLLLTRWSVCHEEPCSDTNWKDLIGLEGGWIGVSKNLKLKNSNVEVKYQPVLPVGLDQYYRLIPVLPMQTDRYYR
jgi:hypothetical protein